ncbi:ABC transporter ATP-binding protein NatA [Polaromonas vacuolata]|uniref:ABC transporter ATP-binding protein NatA n=1 Tax=Polaromonas vacuolata TaxID=37448 RepID=A0A6H2H6K1_9BURK|nr:ABC transporter ATP-binding protein [Polaromonas vacuolata]QJC55489.1 ABC transporter ATP-binding protein NatA [Polaromonas vacuolata]
MVSATHYPFSAASDIVQIRNLSYEDPGVRALNNLSFNVARGSVTALVGPNGAGKSTLLRCMAALEQAFDGDISVDGIDVGEQARECHRRIGYLSDFYGLYDSLSVRQCLTYAALSQGLLKNAVSSAVEQTAQQLNLSLKLDTISKTLSRGQRQRLAIGQALIHTPALLILDEPASGLDPEARHELATLFSQLRAAGMTLIVSSHILAELDEYSTHLLVIRQGCIVENRALNSDSARAERIHVSVQWAQPVESRLVAQLIAPLGGVELVQTSAHEALFLVPPEPCARQALLSALVLGGLPVSAFEPKQENLHQSYLRIMQSANQKGDQQ